MSLTTEETHVKIKNSDKRQKGKKMKIKIETVKDSESARRKLKEEALLKDGYNIPDKQNPMHESIAMFRREENVIIIKMVENAEVKVKEFIHWIHELVIEYEIKKNRTREKEMSIRAMNDETILCECTH